MKIKLKIKRFNPEKDSKPWWGEYEVDVEPTDRVLDALHQVKWFQDGTFNLRRSCAHGVCGSDAVRINGQNKLACKVLMQDIVKKDGDTVTVEPILGLKVIKDLIVDMEPFFAHYRSVMPFFVNDEPAPADGRERLQSIVDRERYDQGTKCILCAACTTSCPSFWSNEEYVGPAAVVQAHRFIFDSRDRAAAERLEVLNQQMGVWRCRTAFNCTNACPREIPITQLIGEVKQTLATGEIK
ncbi:MAG: succinate dehydrogenase iron-sulfur subunit [Chloroflexi bacterium]|nr:succinate dehydrogenase iron-sulfur subunit [Chloroflexota bacterium]MBI5350200.1 succinate dehydrogenase iron-sulfur subunit [Chloroflexota bacterium]MBI5714429.1 succinate dehydrogenase iron-sulfur subunit [Chloroflexota bacterium]